MATIKEVEHIQAWQKAREFARKAYEISNHGTFARDFPLKDQLNESSGSTMDNIAEGFGRGGNREFNNFLSYARGSAAESKSQVYRAYDRKHITKEVLNELINDVNNVSEKINGLIQYLKRSELRGPKFMEPITPYDTDGMTHSAESESSPEAISPARGLPELGTWNQEPGTGDRTRCTMD